MPQLAQRLGFDLADAFARDREGLADFYERAPQAMVPVPIFYGPGNGADIGLEQVAVPIANGTVTQLCVQTKNVAGPGNSYTFTLCHNSNCSTPVTCTISLPTLTECNDLTHTVDYAEGDTLALMGVASTVANPTEVSWSVVVKQTATAASPVLP